MPTSSSPASRESQAALVTALISTDPEMKSLAREYVMAGLREMLQQLQRGDAQTRAAIAKSMSGVVGNLFTQSTGDDGLADLRAEMHEMMSEVRGDMGAHEARAEDEELAEGVLGTAMADAEAGETVEVRVQGRLLVPKS